jgi:FecR protein
MFGTSLVSRALVLLTSIMIGGAASAEETAWSVKKSSGQVWITTPGAEQASLTQETSLRIGDTIRTGSNGRVLLVRGEESILISPNAVISLPSENKDGMTTTVTQQAGTILLDVERRNVKHFEVETPYLAAVVKGTQFQVSVDAAGSHVTVLRGQVEVADFKSGQISQILPGQTAAAFSSGKTGLSLSGAGRFYPIEQGAPRTPSISRIDVPKVGLSAPHGASNGLQIRAIKPMQQAGWGARANQALAASRLATGLNKPAHAGPRLATAIGDVHLDFGKVTHGMARGSTTLHAAARSRTASGTIWSDHSSGATANAAGTSDATSPASAVATAVGAATNTTGNGSAGNGNGDATVTANASGSGNGNQTTGTGNGNGHGGGNGNNSGNNNGNSDSHGNSGSGNGPGNGHGNAYGWHWLQQELSHLH